MDLSECPQTLYEHQRLYRESHKKKIPGPTLKEADLFRCLDCKAVLSRVTDKVGAGNICKPCGSERGRQWRFNNPETYTEYHRQYSETHKESTAERGRQWYISNKEATDERHRQYRETHKESTAESGRQYRLANSELIAESNRQYRETHKESTAESGRQYRLANSELIAESNRQYSETHKEAIAERSRQWRSDNPGKSQAGTHRYRARKAGAEGVLTVTIDELVVRQQGLCYLCIQPIVRPSLDHIIPLNLGGHNADYNVAAACLSCNCTKQDRLLDQLTDRFPDAVVPEWFIPSLLNSSG